jgi:HlyD family secretion protein
VDKQIDKSKFQKHRWKIIGVFSIVLFIAFINWLATPKGITINADTIRIGRVTHGDFQEIIIANGIVEPEKTVLIDAKAGGTILEIKAEEGQIVKSGDVLFTLQNENLIMEYMQRETQIVEQINNLRNTRIALEQNLRSVQDRLDESKKEITQAKRQFLSDSSLFVINGVAKNTYLLAQENYNYLTIKTQTLSNRLKQDQQYQQIQFSRIDASITLMERNLEMIRSTIEEMSIKAPISGQLNSFSLEIGQVLQQNESIGRVDVPGKFKIRAIVDQHYLTRLSIGQSATIELGDSTYRLEIDRVQTLVENGQFEVIMIFTDPPPSTIRRGQNFQVKIEISAETSANMIPRGSFYQISGGNYVYVISKDRSFATKRNISLGKQNPDFFEVLDGLDINEEIITSSYDNFKEKDKVFINP